MMLYCDVLPCRRLAFTVLQPPARPHVLRCTAAAAVATLHCSLPCCAAAQVLHHTLGKAGQLGFELECFRPVTCYQVGGWLCVAPSLHTAAGGATRPQRQQGATNTLERWQLACCLLCLRYLPMLVGAPGSAPCVDPTNEPFLQAQLRLVDTPAEMVRKLYLALRVSSGCLGSKARLSNHNAICARAICLNSEPCCTTHGCDRTV